MARYTNQLNQDQLPEFRTVLYDTVTSESLVPGYFKHTLFSREQLELMGRKLAISCTMSDNHIR